MSDHDFRAFIQEMRRELATVRQEIRAIEKMVKTDITIYKTHRWYHHFTNLFKN